MTEDENDASSTMATLDRLYSVRTAKNITLLCKQLRWRIWKGDRRSGLLHAGFARNSKGNMYNKVWDYVSAVEDSVSKKRRTNIAQGKSLTLESEDIWRTLVDRIQELGMSCIGIQALL